MKFQPDLSQQKALKTWYAEDHPLHLDPRHPLIKLAGEAGELLDLFGKHEYKPEFSWWKCKHCYYNPDDDRVIKYEITHTGFHDYNPLILDELGDFSYYLRILMWQSRMSFCATVADGFYPYELPIEKHLSELAYLASSQYRCWLQSGKVSKGRYHRMIYNFMNILFKVDISLEKLIDLNYRKLNSEPTAHGWKK